MYVTGNETGTHMRGRGKHVYVTGNETGTHMWGRGKHVYVTGNETDTHMRGRGRTDCSIILASSDMQHSLISQQSLFSGHTLTGISLLMLVGADRLCGLVVRVF
jgi:hypothetical protein